MIEIIAEIRALIDKAAASIELAEDEYIGLMASFTVRSAAARGRPLCHALGNRATLCPAVSASASGKPRNSARPPRNGSAAWSVSSVGKPRACKTAICTTTPLPTTTAKIP